MSRVVVAGSKDVISPVVEKLHELRLLHIVNYNGNQPEFALGKPIGKAREYSENLIKLRSVTRYLDIKNKAPEKTYPESQVLSEMDNLLNNVGAMSLPPTIGSLPSKQISSPSRIRSGL